MSKGTILLCAGGTGGHLFPAEAVAHELVARGYDIHLAADERVERFSGQFPAKEIHQIRSATLASKNPVALAKTFYALFAGYLQSRKLLKTIKPVAVAGFGGYPTIPPLFAAHGMGIPTLIHDSNAVLGRANRLLGKRVNKVAIGFGDTSNVGDIQVVVTGNPVRPAILKAAETPYSERTADEPFNLLVFGGSQGAAYFGEVVPKALAKLDATARSKVRLVQQARPEDRDTVVSEYESLEVQATVETFFGDMDEKLAEAHLVIARAGASTVSELAVVGRPSILVPYPYALDHDQAANAAKMSEAGGSVLYQQSVLTPEVLASELVRAIKEPKKLAQSAKNAKKTGRPDATTVLADMIVDLTTA